jgi:hypothetical protein
VRSGTARAGRRWSLARGTGEPRSRAANFDCNASLAPLRIGVDPNAPKEFVDTLKQLGMVPKPIGARPNVAGMAGGDCLHVRPADRCNRRRLKSTD